LKEVVYVLGAGVNQVIKDWDGLAPPLLSNFFNITLKKRKFSNEYYLMRMKEVFDYIEKYFRMTIEDLKKEPFDLEMCFTLLEKQARQAEKGGDKDQYNYLTMILFKLGLLLAEILSEFEIFSHSSYILRNFGRVISHEIPTIITFNYDCIMENILESASGVNPKVPESYKEYHHKFLESISSSTEIIIPDELLTYSHCNWNRPLGYGFKFDEIELCVAGIPPYVRGSRFYSVPENQIYLKPLLKLHGSLNWFRYLPIRRIPTFWGEPEPELGERESSILCKRGFYRFGEPPEHDGWYLNPIIITPTLYKDEYYDKRPFVEIWEKAKNSLSKCEKLVVIGYSFSPTDFTTKQLFLESFLDSNLKELVVVNPNHNLVKVVKDLCHFKGGVAWYANLDEYVGSFSKVIRLERKPIEIDESKLPTDTSPHDVYLMCKTCDIEFDAKIRTNPRSHASSEFIDCIFECPNGHVNSYNKEDFILKKSKENT